MTIVDECQVDHAWVKGDIERFRVCSIPAGHWDFGDEVHLMGNCPVCNTTLNVVVEALDA